MPPMLCSAATGWNGALVRRWRGVDPDIVQPALDSHYLSMHLGGPKRVSRSGEGGRREVEVESGALSVVPAGTAFKWSTVGPIDFAHLYLSPVIARQIGIEVFDRGGSGSALEDRLGTVDLLLQSLFLAMLEEIDSQAAGSRIYLDTLLRSLSVRLLWLYGGGGLRGSPARLSLAPVRLRRVYDFVEANLASDIGVADLAEVANVSQFHFSRAFTSASGSSPYAYLIARRIVLAKTLLHNPDLHISTIAELCGFQTAGQFSRMFKKSTATTPRQFRHHIGF